ncbi:MAG: hypothetical protein RIE08_11305 [Acidimicrobiales bacterium]
MARRIDVELTSRRDDDTWTWRAIGAREPRGELDSSLLWPEAKVGDHVRCEADFSIDGISVVSAGPLVEPERTSAFETLEILGSGAEEKLVTTNFVEGGGRGRGRGRGDRGDRDDRGGGRRDERGAGRRDNDRSRPRGESRQQRERPPEKPKPKRLRPGREHRDAWLAELPEEHKAIADQLVRGGLPAVRQAVEKQNAAARETGEPEIDAAPLEGIAEKLLPTMRIAEWRDRAEAAIAGVDEIDLRDLRSVVVAAEAVQRDEECRAMAEDLRGKVSDRVDREHSEWLAEIASTLGDGRTVRALRLSSRPPKAGVPLPQDLATRLTEAAAAGMGSDATQDRWATVLDAVAFSPIRQMVRPAAIPAEPGEELLAAVRKVSTRVPQIAGLFGIEPTEPPRRRRSRSGRGSDTKPARTAQAETAPAEATTDTPAAPAEQAPSGEAGKNVDVDEKVDQPVDES